MLTTFFNPRAWRSRTILYEQFRDSLRQLGVPLLTVEIAFGNRPHLVTNPTNPWALQLRTSAELWHKERALNLALHRLCQLVPDWRYVAWMDADVRLARPYWWIDAVELLHHYPVIQLFTQARQLLPDHTVQFSCPSFAATYESYGTVEVTQSPTTAQVPRLGHPGLGWAFRRETLEGLGGFLDTCANGSGDMHMANAFIGQPLLAVAGGASPGYKRALLRYAGRAAVHVRKHVGSLPGACDHYWHGRSRERGYEERHELLVRHQFDPDEDLRPDCQGLYQWSGGKPQLEMALKRSLAARNEDSIDP